MVFPNIRNLREDHDYRQRQLAEVLHVSQNTYSQYENNKRQIPLECLIALKNLYNISIDYLLGLE